MRPVSLVAMSVLWALTGCGSTVSVSETGAGGSGGSASGGSASGGAGGAGGNPTGCPTEMPTKWWTDCTEEGLSCVYRDDPCVVTYECKWEGWCEGEGSDYCEEGLVLRPIDETCDVVGVPCEEAQQGDPCDTPGEVCGGAYECETIYKQCGEDFVWQDDSTYDECCPDGCPG